jgi:adenylate cyclase class IV
MARNVEIKAKAHLPNDIAVRARLLSQGGPVVIFQDDTFFDAPQARLKLRDFSDGTAELIAYNRGDEAGPKVSSYTRTPTADPAGLRAALAQAMPVIGRVVKTRQLYLIGQTRVHLDDVQGLGHFVELEVVLADDESAEVGAGIAQQLMQSLGIDQADLISHAYIDLLNQSGSQQKEPS